MEQVVHAFTLPSGKVVQFREPTPLDMEEAITLSGEGVKDNPSAIGIKASNEMARRLLVRIDGKALSLLEKQKLEMLFNFKEYLQVTAIVGWLTSPEEGKPPAFLKKVEVLPSQNTPTDATSASN